MAKITIAVVIFTLIQISSVSHATELEIVDVPSRGTAMRLVVDWP